MNEQAIRLSPEARERIKQRLASMAESQLDLFGGEPKSITAKSKIESDPKVRQLDLIPGLGDARGQIVMFDEPGMPDDLVYKPEGE